MKTRFFALAALALALVACNCSLTFLVDYFQS